ncbi:MAG: PPOX class F420-dependent oxidoreductase [Actinomycetota bacterium]|nr:PPOX class F420-dependent oxidoreductase [Actinomycetota bacterium]
MHDALSQFHSEKYMSLETFRKSGEGVKTPVWFAEEDGALYVTTLSTTGKAKRIRNIPRVRIAPCDRSGNIEGDWIEGQAKLLTGEEAKRADKFLNKKYGLAKKAFSVAYNFTKGDPALIEVRPAADNS